MNTTVLLAAEESEQAALGLMAAQAFIEETEQRFSRFVSESEISRLNQSAGRWHEVSVDLMEILRLSLAFHEETDGLFDPSILPDLKRVGYDTSMDDIRLHGASLGLASSPTGRRGYRQLKLDVEGQRVLLPQAMEIDLGGIAKGWIVERAAALLKCYTSACGVSAGGDIVFMGDRLNGGDWEVHVEDPLNPENAIARLRVPEGAVATSSIVKRAWNQAGMRRHHIIDPRTGEPALTDLLSVTVCAQSITVAEVYAKVLLISGEQGARRLMSRRPEISCLMVRSDGSLLRVPARTEDSYEYNPA